jgi:hypothetical protein
LISPFGSANLEKENKNNFPPNLNQLKSIDFVNENYRSIKPTLQSNNRIEKKIRLSIKFEAENENKN